MTSPPIGRRPQLAEDVAEHVRARIMAGDLRPGDFVRLDETAAGLGVSVTPVREALLTLRGEGLVDLVPRRGYLVSPMSRQDVDDIFWLQATLAAQVLERALPLFGPDDCDTLDRLVDEFEAASGADKVMRTQYAIFRKINKVSGADKLARFLASAARYMPYKFYVDDESWRCHALECNRCLADAIRAGDLEAAIEAARVEFSDGSRRLIAHLEAAGVWADDTADDGDGRSGRTADAAVS